MSRIKNYLVRQSRRNAKDLAYDFCVVGGFFTCIYIGFIQ